MTAADAPALFAALPALASRVPWVRLGAWPTPVERLEVGRGDVWVKREDLTSPVYGGNKVRTLEAMFGRARAAGARCIWATGAFGSNHVVATVMHARAAGLDAGAILFPQPPSDPAIANASAIVAAGGAIVTVPSVAFLPAAMMSVRRRPGAYVMPPGGATPEGALGALSAAFELAAQARAGDAPWPATVVVPVGSGCTTAGLLAGFHLAHALGLAPPPPRVRAVRVTPWPITSRLRLAYLAYRTLAALDRVLSGDRTAGDRASGGRTADRASADRTDGDRARAAGRIRYAALVAGLEVDGRFLGRGYGHVTARGEAAAATLARAGLPFADPVYAAKAAASLLDEAVPAAGPRLLWFTKSSAPLPRASSAALDRAPRALRAWIGR